MASYNVQMSYFNGTSYDELYPKGNFGNMSGSLTSDQIPSLNASKITTGTFGGSKGTEYIFPGNIRIGGTASNSDARIRIGDGDYVYLHEDSDDNLTIKAKRIEFTTTANPGLTNNGVAIGGSGLKSYNGMSAPTASTNNKITLTFYPQLVLCGDVLYYSSWGMAIRSGVATILNSSSGSPKTGRWDVTWANNSFTYSINTLEVQANNGGVYFFIAGT